VTDLVRVDIDGAVAVVTLNRTERRNAINAELTDALRAAVDRIEADDAVRVGVLTGAGSVFCAGMDLNAYTGGEGPHILQGRYGFAGFVRHPRRKPFIAAVNGAALAGGFELVLACDLAVAEDSAVFAFPEAGLGILAAAGGLVRLPARVPPVVALEVLIAGRQLTADDAYRLGLLNAVVGARQSLSAAMELAERIVRAAPESVTQSLKVARVAAGDEAPAWYASDAAWAELSVTRDAAEGPLAFVERRPPIWGAV
jgi:enoyl-CoA hydratase